MSLPERIGPYAIERELGRGGMGIVYAGVHAEVGRPAAIKVLLNEQKGEDRFWRECEALGQLRHPGIVQVYEAGVHGGHPYLALEFVPGKTLDDALTTGGTWDSERTARLGLELCDAMAYVHERGLLHRDLKPENVLLDAEGKAKITDFGLVRGVGVEALTKTGVMVGTPAFMPPEQAGGEKQKVCAASDVYSLGATLFMVLTGQPPFRGDSPYSTIALVFTQPPPRASSLVPSVDPVLDEILLRCLAKQPQDRYPDAAALGEALRAYLGGELQVDRAPRTALIAGIAVLSCLALVIGGLVIKKHASRRDQTPTPQATQRTPLEARQAWRKLKRKGTSAELRQWCQDFAEVAGEDLPKVRRRLAEVSWEELGGPEPKAGDDLRRLRWFHGASEWLREHAEHAPKTLADQARALESPWKSSKDVPVLCALTLTPMRSSKDSRDAYPLSLGGERILAFGHGGAKVWSPPESFERMPLGESEEDHKVVFAGRTGEVLTLIRHGQILRKSSRGIEAAPYLDVAAGTAAVRSGLAPYAAVALGERTLVVGESVTAQGKDAGGGAYGLFEGPLGQAPFPPIERFPSHIRSVVANRAQTRVYMVGGGSGALDADYFLSELEVGPAGLGRRRTYVTQAAGINVGLSPDEERLFVGLNRGGGSLYLTGELGRLPLILGPTPKGSREDTAAGVAIQAVGAAFLEHGLLVSYEFAATRAKKGAGWLAFYPRERVNAAAIRAAADNPGTPTTPAWIRKLSGSPRGLVTNAAGTLLYVGSREGKLWVIPAPPADLAQ